MTKDSYGIAGNFHHLQRRWHFFSATHPTHQSSDEHFRPGQKIVINPTGGSSDTHKKQLHRNKKRLKRSSQPVFIDRIHIKTRGGNGGAGGQAYHKLGSYKQKPCGGHGGHGGNVYLITDPTLSSLKMEKHHYTGQDGGRGTKSNMNGKNANDLYVRVPCGVVVRRVLEWDEMEELYGEDVDDQNEGNVDFEASTLGDIRSDSGVDDSEYTTQLYGEDVNEEDEGDVDLEALTLEDIDSDSGVDDPENTAQLSNTANNIDTTLDQEDHQTDQHISSREIDEEDEDGIERENYEEDEVGIEGETENSDGEEEEEEDFDTYLARLHSSKRQRKRGRRRGYLPSDYDDVVNQEVRADDGMFYWSSPDAEDVYDEEGNLMASTAYPSHSLSNPTRKTVLMADLDKPRTSLLVAAGGKAGVGNQAYANRPHFTEMEGNAAKKAIPGKGESTYLELELKLIADVGLVGFPNAGKSSLLSAMSKARPKIASYPFTTLDPLVGSIQYKDGHSIIMADVPGLIDGAAEGRGRGIEFLRHIERTKALVYMVDAAGVDGRDPINDLKILGNELREYGSSGIFGENEMGGDGDGEYGEEMRKRRREIMNRPSLILANKMDLISEVDAGIGRRDELLFHLSQVAKEVGIVTESHDILGISAGVTGEGLKVLSKRLRQVVHEVDSP